MKYILWKNHTQVFGELELLQFSSSCKCSTVLTCKNLWKVGNAEILSNVVQKRMGKPTFLICMGRNSQRKILVHVNIFCTEINYRQAFRNNKSWKEKSHQHLTVQQLFLYNMFINIYLPAIMRSYDIQQSRTIHLKRILMFRVVEYNFTCWPAVVWR